MAKQGNLAVALELARIGIPVFPAHVLRRRSNSWMKKPAIEGWRTLATTDEAQIQTWWHQFPRAVPGIELERAGLVVIDPDRHGNGADGLESFAQLCADLGGLPKHPITNTPAGNHHIFAQPEGRPLAIAQAASLPVSIFAARAVGSWRRARCAPTALSMRPAAARRPCSTPIAHERSRHCRNPSPTSFELGALLARMTGAIAIAITVMLPVPPS